MDFVIWGNVLVNKEIELFVINSFLFFITSDFCGYVDINKEIEEHFGQSERPPEFADDVTEDSSNQPKSKWEGLENNRCSVFTFLWSSINTLDPLNLILEKKFWS